MGVIEQGCMERCMERMQVMAESAETLLVGADENIAAKIDRYMLARLMSSFGFTNGKISAMTSSLMCR